MISQVTAQTANQHHDTCNIPGHSFVITEELIIVNNERKHTIRNTDTYACESFRSTHNYEFYYHTSQKLVFSVLQLSALLLFSMPHIFTLPLRMPHWCKLFVLEVQCYKSEYSLRNPELPVGAVNRSD